MIPTLIAISVIVFTIIQLPPGDYLDDLHRRAAGQGEAVDPQKIAVPARAVRPRQAASSSSTCAGSGGLLQGDFGYSFEYNLPVTKVVGDRLFLTFIVSFATILFTWAVAFPIGIYSATHQYSWGDYGLTLARLPRPRDAELPAGAGAAVLRQRAVRHLDRRPDGPGVSSTSRGAGRRSVSVLRAPAGSR